MRLVVVTFALLAVAWYELSGGAEFEPGDVSLTLFAEPDYAGPVLFAGLLDGPGEGVRQSRVRQAAVNVAETRASAIERAVAKSPNADVVLASASDVDLPRLSEVARRGFSPRAGQGPVFATAEGMALRSGQGNAFGGSGQGHAFGSGQGGAFDPTVAGSEDRPAMIEPRDIRHVADSRVPLYARPGEGAEILVELLRGEPVAILRDGATGWVQLNAIDGGTIGWAESRHLEPAGSATLASN